MSRQLPLVSAYEKQHTYCSYCPKMCRFSCPVSTVQARETTTPWAKMTALHHVANGTLGLSASVAQSWYGCTGCMRCRTHCAHQNDVASALQASRSEAVRLGAAPDEAVAVVKRHERRLRHAAERARQLFREQPVFGEQSDGATVAFVPGCTATTQLEEDALAGHKVCDQLHEGETAVVADGCCGLPLLDAGDMDGFVNSATRWVKRLQRYDTVVFGDPGCMHALKVRAPELGVPGAGGNWLHLSQWAEQHLEHFEPGSQPTAMRYHDPCKLGRGLGVFDAPRRVLAHVLGRPVDEFHRRREDASCSGGGGQLPRTDASASKAISTQRLQEHQWVGGGTVVSACPASTRQFRTAGNVEVISLTSLLSHHLRAT